jgi:hypothetical protein
VIALDAELAPDAGAESELARQRLQDAGPRLALAQVLLERRAQPQDRQRRFRVRLDQVLVQAKTIGQRAQQVRRARGQRPRPLAQPLPSDDAQPVRQVDLGGALGVGRDRRLAAPAVAVARLLGLGGQRPHLDHRRVDAGVLAWAEPDRAAQARGQGQRRVDAEQGLVPVLPDRVDQRGVVERQRAVPRGDVDHRGARAVDPERGQRGLLPLAAAEVDPQHVDEIARPHVGSACGIARHPSTFDLACAAPYSCG